MWNVEPVLSGPHLLFQVVRKRWLVTDPSEYRNSFNFELTPPHSRQDHIMISSSPAQTTVDARR
jgi:hypothetical protein